MGLRRWLRQFYVKVREAVGWEKDYNGQYDNLDCWAYFDNGSSWHWEGRPWVYTFELDSIQAKLHGPLGGGESTERINCPRFRSKADFNLWTGFKLGEV